MKLISKTKCFAAPGPKTVAYENEYYTRPSGPEKLRYRFIEVSDDIFDHGEHAFSLDNGRTWPETRSFPMGEKSAAGTIRRIDGTGYVDAVNGRLLNIVVEGLLPADNALDGMSAYYLDYRVSEDGGHTALVTERLVQRGDYSPEHPIEHVWVGKNALVFGAESSVLRTNAGHLLVATCITPLGPDGTYYNPGGGYTYHEVVLLLGHWQDDGRIEWELGPKVSADPKLSTRGAIEPTLAQMQDGRILMVMRGSNDARHEVAGTKWYCVSSDAGRSWSEMQPWTYADGTPFFSPSSISQLVSHSNGRHYWIGNICPDNPYGNGPRYPVVIGQVDPVSLLLLPDTVLEIDTKGPDDDESLSLSNFCAHEDRETGELIFHMTRMQSPASGYCGDAYAYRIEI